MEFLWFFFLFLNSKKKATSKKPSSSSATSSSKKVSVKRKAVTDPSDQSHSETEGDGKSTKGVKKSTAKKPATKGALTTPQAKKRKPESATDVASKDDSQKKKKPKLEDPTASPSKKSEPIKKKATGSSDTAKEEPKTEGVTPTSNGDVSDKPGNAQNGEKDGRPTSHTAGTDAATTSSQQSSMSVDEKPKKGANKPVKLTPLDPAVEKIMQRLREDVAKGKVSWLEVGFSQNGPTPSEYLSLFLTCRGLCGEIKVSTYFTTYRVGCRNACFPPDEWAWW